MNFKLIFLVLLFALQVYSQPTIDWYRTYDDEQHYLDGSTCAAMDESGNAYVSGEAYNYYNQRSSEYDIVTIKYSPTGEQLWVRKYHNFNYDGAVKMYYHNNNIYILAWSQDSLDYRMNAVVLKYDVYGELIWLKRIGNISYFEYQPNDLIAGPNFDFIYLTGYYYNNDSARGVVHKMDSNGVILWEKKIQYQSYENTILLKSILDPAGNIYTGGNIYLNYPNYDPKSLFVKIDNDGNVIWYKTDSIKYVIDIAKNSQNEIFILSIKSLQDYHTAINIFKLTSSGNLVWNITKPGAYNLNNYSNSFPIIKFMDIDNHQDIIVACSSESIPHRNSLSIYKFNTEGNEIWHYLDTMIIKPTGICIDTISNHIYVNTVSRFYNNYNNTHLTKLSSSGNLVWKIGNKYNSIPYGLIVKNNTIITSGYSDGELWNSDYLTIKYTQPIGIQPISSEIPDNFSLSQNYPNPFNPTTKIRFGIPSNVKSETSNVKIIIYDVLGREINTLVNEQLKLGVYEVEFDGTELPSGVYFYKLFTNGFSETKKMVLVK